MKNIEKLYVVNGVCSGIRLPNMEAIDFANCRYILGRWRILRIWPGLWYSEKNWYFAKKSDILHKKARQWKNWRAFFIQWELLLDKNSRSEFIINWFAPLDTKAYPFATKNDITQQLPNLRRKVLKYESYAKETYETLFDATQQQEAIPYEVTNLQTSVLWNNGGSFSLQALPLEAQLAPIFAIVVDDFNGDQQPDIWLGGNFYSLKPQVGRHDASRGVLLLGKGDQRFEPLGYRESGIRVDGEVRDAKILKVGGEKVLLVARNNETLQAFKRQ